MSAIVGNNVLYDLDYGWGANEMDLSQYTMPVAGYITKMFLGRHPPGGNPEPFRAVIYGGDGALVWASDPVQCLPGTGWQEVPVPNVYLPAGPFWMGSWTEPGKQIAFYTDRVFWDGTGVFRVYYATEAGSTPPATLVGLPIGNSYTNEMSNYAEYRTAPPPLTHVLAIDSAPIQGITLTLTKV